LEIFCGIDWSESHHDVALVDQAGTVVARRRISDDLTGFTDLTALLAEHVGAEFVSVDVAIETDRGLLVAALKAAGHRVFAINPKAVDRYRDRHSVSGAKSDLLTELRRVRGGSGRQVLVGASTLAGRGRRRGRGSGSVPVGRGAAWVA
jgi:hypothetical protein